MKHSTLGKVQHSIAAWFESAKAQPELFVGGLFWYDDEARKLSNIAAATGYHTDLVANAASVLSKQTKWEHLVDRLERWIEDPTAPLAAYGHSKVWARGILDGTGAFPQFERAPKLYSFARNLLGDTNAVTIDTWMVRAAGQDPTKPFNYRMLSFVVRDLAAGVHLTPRDYQSIVWASIRSAF